MTEELYIERHRKLLEYQKSIWPWTPKVRNISVLWGLKGTAPALHVLRKMVGRGDAIMQECGRKHEYYAVEKSNA